MSSPDIDLTLGALAAVHDAVRAAADRLDGVGPAPAAPDAGDATADLLSIMAELLSRASEVAVGSAAAADLVAQNRTEYEAVETTNATSFGGSG